MKRTLLSSFAMALLALGFLASCNKEDSSTTPAGGGATGPGGDGITVAFVSNNASDFWQIAKAGVEKAEKEFGVLCEFKMPDGTAADQKRIVEELIAMRVSGVAISPNDPANQTEFLNQVASQMNLICHDSDAPESKRMAYVGTNNYKAGVEAGKLIKEVLPNGGKIMLFVGNIDAQNAKERAQGIKDEIAGTNITVIDIRTDQADRPKAKSNVQDTLANYPDIACLVGLWSYNTPMILSAVKDAGKQGKIPIVGFDEEDETLQGVLDGHIHATVVQQPYEFGYQSVKMLAALARKQDAGIPENKIVDVPVKIVKKDNVQAFWDELKKLRGK